MNFKVMCFGIGEKDFYNTSIGALSCINSVYKEGGIGKTYYKSDNDKFEVIYVNENNIELYNNVKNRDGFLVILVDVLNSETFFLMKDICKNSNVMIFVGKNEMCNNYKLENTICFKQLNDKEDLQLMPLLLMISEYCSEVRLREKLYGSSIIVGHGKGENATSDIVIKILKRFSNIQNHKKHYLNLFSERKLNIEEISYLEDPLKEYIDYDVSLIIKQLTNEDLRKKILFYLISKK